jgi:hypothetical protein
MAVKAMLAKKEACQQVLYAVHVLYAWKTVIGGLRKKRYFMFTKENRYLCNGMYTPEGYQVSSCADKSRITLISRLDSTPQSLFPKTAYAILLAPLLHHPSLKLIPNNFPLVDLRRRILLLATSCFSLVLQPSDFSSQTLSVQPRREIFKHNRVIQQDLFVPRRRGHVLADRSGFNDLGNLWED